jgi:transcriptional regulator with GAF, ATPase, and Fis domain
VASNGTVLITGASGVGKEHVVRVLHRYRDPDANTLLIAVNRAALTETLIETETLRS